MIKIVSGGNRITIDKPKPKWYFNGDKSWLFYICEEGIKFNHEDYPNLKQDDFAREFCDILEKTYNISFERKES